MTVPVIHPWNIVMNGPITDYSESIFATGNGYLGVRGFSLQEAKSNPQEHAIFRAGFFEPVKPGITDMVQLPDVLGMVVEGYHPASFSQSLDMKESILTQKWTENGLTVSVDRMISMADRTLICIRMTLVSEKKCTLTVNVSMNENVANLPVHDDQMTEETETVRLLKRISHTENELIMRAQSSGRRIRFVQSVLLDNQQLSGDILHLNAEAGIPVVLEKRIKVLFEGETEVEIESDPWQAHQSAWKKLWEDCDIEMDADEEIQGALRWNIFQMLCNNASDDSSVSIGARGLTHGRYKGNTFWDTDIFLLPFFCWQRPKAAENLILYRVSHLSEAKTLAAKQNLSGARYPWMCAADGSEQCESWDIGFCETHITADVAYALYRMTEITGLSMTVDMKAVLADTARYWKSRFTWEGKKQQYSSFFVKGPDEYCGAAINNTYTNYMAKHNVELALQYADDLFDDQEKKELQFFADHIVILYDPEQHLYIQDENFERLEPLPVNKASGEPLYRTICFDRMQRYQALKQADLVQLMVLFPDHFSDEEKRAVWRKYEPLTVHDSSLSFGVHAHLAFLLGLKKEGWDYFCRSLMFDLRDILRNTGHEGVHMASLGATWQALVYGMLGIWIKDGKITSHVCLPDEIRSVSMPIHSNGKKYRVTASQEQITIKEEDRSVHT